MGALIIIQPTFEASIMSSFVSLATIHSIFLTLRKFPLSYASGHLGRSHVNLKCLK